MIQITQQPEPASFNGTVRTPGITFLTRVPRPTTRQWNQERHWKLSLDDLYTAYNGVCAYSCHWIPRDTARETVDHFIPKATAPHLAYEWDNYRLASEKMNNYKGESLVVMDPFVIKDGWFTLDFPSFLIKPEGALPPYVKRAIKETIACLRLNDDDKCVQERLNWTLHYCDGELTMSFLERRCPFIAHELKRQGLQERIRDILRRRKP